MKNILTKEQLWQYFILTCRFLLAWTFIGYGYSKLTDGQFGVNEIDMITQLKDISFFKLSWYLFDQQPFKAFVGISQIVCGLLFIFNRTAILGAFFFLPIVSTILIIDLSFMPPVLAYGFAWRLSFYILLDFLILWQYKSKLKIIWDAVWNNVNTKFSFPIWAYLLLPIFAIVLEAIQVIPKLIVHMILHPSKTIQAWSKIPEYLAEILN